MALGLHTVSVESCNATWHSMQAIFKTPFSQTFVFHLSQDGFTQATHACKIQKGKYAD